MKKAFGVWKLIALCTPIITLLLIVTLVATMYAEAQRELAALLALKDEYVSLRFEGEYDDTNLNLHIWSEGTDTEQSVGGGISGSAQDVIDGACAWAVAIANDNRFHYGPGGSTIKNGCYFCGTNTKKRKPGTTSYEFTYVCNSFVNAAFAHGGGEPTCLKWCQKGGALGLGTGKNDFAGSDLFEHLGRIPQSQLQKGDVIVWPGHVMLYLGDGTIAHAGYQDDNKSGSDKWNKSICVENLTDSWHYRKYKNNYTVHRYKGTGGGVMEVSGASDVSTAGYEKKEQFEVLQEIGRSSGKRYSIGYIEGTSSNCAQSFAYANGLFAVAFVNSDQPPGYVKLYSKNGKSITQTRCDAIYHANGACSTPDGKVMVAGALQNGHNDKGQLFSVGTKAVSEGAQNLPANASSIAYDRETGRYILAAGSSMRVYDSSLTNKTGTVSRNMHGTYYQDIGAGYGYIFACHTASKGNEERGSNYIDIYSEDTGDYCGSYRVNYGELESCDIVDGELVVLVHILGYVNYIQYTGIKVGSSMSSSSYNIDFWVSAKKSKIGNAWQLSKRDISAGPITGALNATAVIDSGSAVINGTLFDGRMRLKGRAAKGKTSGRGWLEKNFSSLSGGVDDSVGRATYVGVDDSDTDHSRKIAAVLGKWSNAFNPFYNGYGGLCESWVCDVYSAAGLPVNGQCCAYTHCAKEAHQDGNIPKGALIFSGKRRDGSMYENGHRPGAYCDVCGHWAGHVAIYIGGGKVAGSQIPYIMSVDTWIDMYGYGGWSLK